MQKLTAAILSVFNLLWTNASCAQEFDRCYTTEIYRELIINHPEILSAQRTLEKQTRHPSVEALAGMQRTQGTVRVIPIVFHIVHNYGPENISDAQVLDQVRILNEDFRLQNADTVSIVPAFKSIAADCEIEFRLATIDPQGNCTNGIDRIVSNLTENAGDNSKLNPWPDNQYLNIWVVKSLAWSGVAAYAYYPGTAPAGADGIISQHRYIGSIGTGTPNTSRVLTHEVGHCLNLTHVWGDTNDPGVSCGDDGVSDTPITEGWTSCNLSGSSCGNTLDNVQNYMEYAYCDKMFTLGQKIRMHDALNSFVGGRDNLWTPANLAATGTNGTSPVPCAPNPDFLPNLPAVCEGNTVQFRDLSWNGHPTTWSWSFPGGLPSTSSDSMPVIQYLSAGTYNATLTAGNATGSNTVTKTAVVRVGGPSVNAIPYAESFEPAGSFPGPDAHVVNYDNGNTWQRVSNAASSGSHCMMINNYSGNMTGAKDEFVTGGFDLTGMTAPVMTFKVAYSERDTSLDDMLTVSASDDCGKTWVTRYQKNGANLSTTGTLHTGNFIPTATQWRQESVTFWTMRNKPNVRFRFQNTSEEGNNIYVDEINITTVPVGMEEIGEAGKALSVYPNPASGPSTVRFYSDKKTTTTLDLQDMAGRTIENIYSGILNGGLHEFTLGANLPGGIYFIRLQDNEGIHIERLLVAH